MRLTNTECGDGRGQQQVIVAAVACAERQVAARRSHGLEVFDLLAKGFRVANAFSDVQLAALKNCAQKQNQIRLGTAISDVVARNTKGLITAITSPDATHVWTWSAGGLPMLKARRQSGEELGDLRPLQRRFHRRAKIDTNCP